MPRVPSGVTSPPEVPGQPYDATAPGDRSDPQTASGTIYNSRGGPGSAEPWVKVRDGGAIDMSTGASNPGSWPDDGASSGGAWKQT